MNPHSCKPALALTLDLEWWGRAHLLPQVPSFPDGIERDIAALEQFLALLAAHSIPATFFTVANDFDSGVLRRIVAAGGEIASHSLTHPHFARLTQEAWKTEVTESKQRLEDAAGVQVTGFRAPSWSIPYERAGEFHDVLRGAGYAYDSSFCGLKTPLYGDPRFGSRPYVGASGLVEIPVPLIGRPRAPWIGGAYFRLAPRILLQSWIRGACPAFLYFHPWEFYEREPVRGTIMTRLAINHGRRGNLAKLARLISALKDSVRFRTMQEYAEEVRGNSAGPAS